MRPIYSLWVEGSDIAGVGVRHRPQPLFCFVELGMLMVSKPRQAGAT